MSTTFHKGLTGANIHTPFNHTGPTAPGSPVEGWVWRDTSTNPNVIWVRDSGAWVRIGAADADDIDDTSTTHKFTTAADIAKLAGIEAGADVTDAANVDAAGAVMNTGNETIAGTKTFSSPPVVPTPTADGHAASKAYVDTAAAAGGPDILSDLSDVGVGVPTDGDFLRYNTTFGLWLNGQLLVGGLADVQFSGDPTTGQVLKFNGTNWTNGADDGGSGSSVDSVNGYIGDVVLDPDDLDDASTTHKFLTTTELAKLAGIETGADVTDAANVAAAGAVMDTGNETIAGIKTFSSSPVVPTPTTDFQAATKKYVDDNVGGGGGATNLDGLTDVTLTAPTAGQVLKYSGSAWINDTDATTSGGGTVSVGATPPGSPSANQLHLDSDNGIWYLRNAANTHWRQLEGGRISALAFWDGSSAHNVFMQDAIDYAHSETFAPVVVFPRFNYEVEDTLIFYAGSKLMGEGSGSTHIGNPKFLWEGDDNIDFFQQQSISEPSNSFQTWLMNIGPSKSGTFDGSGEFTFSGNTFRHGIHFTNRGDSGTKTIDVGAQYGYGYGICFAKGGINVEVIRGRSDGMGGGQDGNGSGMGTGINGPGGFIYFKPGGSANPVDNIKVTGQWTSDCKTFNGRPYTGSSITIDHTNNTYGQHQLNGGKVEMNKPVLPGYGGLTLITNPSFGSQPAMNILMDNMWFPHNPTYPNEPDIMVTPATDNVAIVGMRCQIRNVSGIPHYNSHLTGSGGRHDFFIIGGKGARFGGGSGEWHGNNEFLAKNFHQMPYYSGKDATFLVQVNPTSGLDAGTIVWPGMMFSTYSSGTVTYWRCTGRGVAGTLSGVTGSISSGSNQMTVNTITGLETGQEISIAGAGSGGAALNTYIVHIWGTTIQLNNNANTTVSGAAVSYRAPSFVSKSDTGWA